jgi:glycosyltransferase involved in cell wall biosynthesis
MLISVVIATYNSEKTLEKCLLSVLNQSNKCFEILIKDGGSSDNTLNIISKYQPLFNFFNSGKDNGVYDAWNTCLNNCNGDWIIFLGSDDYFVNNYFFDDIKPYLEKGLIDNARIIHGMNLIVDENGNEVVILGEDISKFSKFFFERMPIRHPGCFHHKSIFKEIGFFDTNYKIIGDYQFVLRALNFTNLMFYPFIGVIHANGGISTNPTYVSKIIYENIKMRKQLNIKPYFKLNMDMAKRILILLIVKLFGLNFGSKVIRIISQIKN